jgi:mannose-6-phosphate isomerase-like protein (cupin superfamily)
MRTSSESDKVITSELWPPELDAMIAAPTHHRLLLENDRVRVLDTEIQPGDKTTVHSHQWPAVHYVLSWSAFVRRNESDAVLLDTRTTAFAQAPPQVMWGEPLPAHSLENVGETSLHIISVEQKAGPLSQGELTHNTR